MSTQDVVKIFSRLPDEKKIKFTEENLEAINKIMADPKTKTKFLRQFLTLFFTSEKQNISPQQVQTMKQLLVSFLFSLKPEFMYEWAQIVDLTVGFPLPEGFEERKQYVKSRNWFHIGLKPELWRKVNEKMDELGSVESFFIESLEALPKKRGRPRKA